MPPARKGIPGARGSLLAGAALLAGGCSGEAPTAEALLDVTVHGSVAPYRTEFTGHFVFVRDGRRIRRSLAGSGNLNEIVRGERIEYVVVQRTSENGVIGLVVSENRETVYDSGIRDTNELLVYDPGDSG